MSKYKIDDKLSIDYLEHCQDDHTFIVKYISTGEYNHVVDGKIKKQVETIYSCNCFEWYPESKLSICLKK